MFSVITRIWNRLRNMIFGRPDVPTFKIEKSEMNHTFKDDADRETTFFLHSFDGAEEELYN